jgi:S-(hydroxymethyl)glutathione dehydrogenase/alcohol dehydrogenase
MKFSAAVLVETGSPLKIVEDIEIPKLEAGQVLVKVAFAGICHSQLMEQAGHRGIGKYLPHLLGHEGSGTVIDIGEGVKKVRTGQRVVLGWLKGAGMDVKGAVYNSPIGKINSGAVTTFSEYTIVSENRCYPLPHNISMQEGVLLGCALPTGMGIIRNQINPSSNSTIGFVGLGGIGKSALISGSCLPNRFLLAIDTNDNKLALAKELGADFCINPDSEDVHVKVAELTQNNMLDYAVEAAGSCKTIELAFSLIHKQHGSCIFASHPPAGQKIQLDPFELICGKTITGSWGGCSNPEHVSQFVSAHKSEINFSPFMSNTYRLADINLAMEELSQQKILRAIICMEQ